MKSEMIMHYENPANGFFEALPLGNGRLGGMIYGHPMKDQIILNESSMWSGSPEDSDRLDAHTYLPAIRRLLFEGKNYEAQELFSKHFTCQGGGTMYANSANGPFGCYQVLGTLRFFFFQAVSYSNQSCDSVRDYTRDLYLEKAKAVVDFQVHDEVFTREYISSAPDQVLAAHFSAKQPASLNFIIALDREENFETCILPDMTMQMTGQLDDGFSGNGVRYACHVKVAVKGGEIDSNSGRLCVKNADEATVYITAATNLQGFLGRNIVDETAFSLAEVNAAYEKGWNAIYADHLQEYQQYFLRNTLAFGKPNDYSNVDLKERIRSYTLDTDDYGLYELYYNFARYLLLGSSRPGGMPCNLQGIWAEEIQTPWNGDWHLNAQQELYWLAEVGNLSEMHIPYLDLTEKLVEPGEKTAKAYYNMEGWLVHTCTNPWGFTSPCEDASWGSTTGSSAWQCHHMWDHYLYTCDKEYLAWAYPIMKAAALFYVDMLVEEPQYQWLVTSPSSSPENSYLDEMGRKTSLCMGPAYDTQLIRSLFSYCIQAEAILQKDTTFSKLLQGKLDRMAPILISSDGRIQEWMEEYKEALLHHRHLSHLWGLYPGFLMSAEHTPDLAKAAAKTLDVRGITTAGWANAYRLCTWAKLRNADKAYETLTMAFRAATSYNLLNLAFHCDEMAEVPEIPDIAHNYYPFQMDGNQGHAAGIALMLFDDYAVISQNETIETEIYLLPALPKRLGSGAVTGMKARGGFIVSFLWKEDGRVKGSITNLYGNKAVILLEGKVLAATHQEGEEIAFTGKRLVRTTGKKG